MIKLSVSSCSLDYGTASVWPNKKDYIERKTTFSQTHQLSSFEMFLWRLLWRRVSAPRKVPRLFGLTTMVVSFFASRFANGLESSIRNVNIPKYLICRIWSPTSYLKIYQSGIPASANNNQIPSHRNISLAPPWPPSEASTPLGWAHLPILPKQHRQHRSHGWVPCSARGFGFGWFCRWWPPNGNPAPQPSPSNCYTRSLSRNIHTPITPKHEVQKQHVIIPAKAIGLDGDFSWPRWQLQCTLSSNPMRVFSYSFAVFVAAYVPFRHPRSHNFSQVGATSVHVDFAFWHCLTWKSCWKIPELPLQLRLLVSFWRVNTPIVYQSI